MQTSSNAKGMLRTIGLFLAGVVVLVGGAALYLWFGLVKPYAEKLERPRVSLLKKIAAAQTRFREQDLDRDGLRDFAHLNELVKAKPLTDKEVYKAGLVYTEPTTSDPKIRWWAVAQPLHPMQGRSFFINQTGTLYVAVDAFDLEARINRKTGGVPKGMQVMREP